MGGNSSTISTSEQRILSLQVQQSSQGLTLPVVYGRTRIAGNLIWYGDFTTIEKTTTTRSGKGGGVTQSNTTYTYEAAIVMALCEGSIKGIVSVWRDKEKFHRSAGLAELRLSLATGTRDQSVWSHLTSKHSAEAIGYSDTAYVRSPNYELAAGAKIYNHSFEIDGKLGYSSLIPDANPRDILVDLLTNENYGCGFPTENIGGTDVYSTYCRAHGLFLSPAYSEQSAAQENISTLLQQTNSAAVFSEGQLKIVPYGDAPAFGNSAAYVPNLTPLYDLTDDDFLSDGEDPVSVDRKTNADAYNQVQIEYLDRANDYNIAIAEAKDQANIEKYGLRPQEAIQMHAICDAAVAQQVAQLTLQRALYVRNEYSFKLGWKFALLEPMDLVTLTDAGLGLDKFPVRIVEIEEDEGGTLSVRAEDFPFGSASATQYPTQTNSGYSANYNVAAGNAYAPVMFEAPLQLTNNDPQIWLATAGGDNWGGAEVWVSTDGDSYKRAGSVNSKARYGSLMAGLPAGAVYDSANILSVQLLAGSLSSGTEQDARDLVTACYVDGEFMAYQTATLKGVGAYDLTSLVRGAHGSTVGSHVAGKPFVRMDDALFKYSFDKSWLGKTVWVKLVSYNIYGSGMQNLSEVPAYSYVIVGAPLGQVTNLRLTSAWSYGKNASIAWDKLDGADSYDVEVYAATSQVRLRLIEGVVDNQFTYTLADMKADGGQVRDVVFRVRGRAVTSKTGAWSQVVAQNPQLKALTGITIEEGLNQAFLKCNTPDEEDFAGLQAWVSTDAACPAIAANLAYDGADTFITLNKCNGKALESGVNYYLRVAGYDSFDKSSLNVSSSIKFNVYGVDAVAKELSESNLAASLKSRIDLIDGTGAGSVHAQISEVNRAAVERDRAVTEQLSTVQARMSGNEASITTLQNTVATQNEARATEIKTLRASVDGNSAAVQTQATSISGLEAQYAVKVDVNGHVSGYGLATTAVDGAPKSRFIVSANQFGIGATGASTTYPFTVDTDTNTVGVNGALVVNGKAIIDKLNAGDITGDKLAANSVTANRLVAGTLTAREIGAKSVTADKMNVTSLSAVSANMGDVTAGTVTGVTINSSIFNGGSLSIGDGAAVIDENGNASFQNAYVSGYADIGGGTFRGSLISDDITGDVGRVYMFEPHDGHRAKLVLGSAPRPRIVQFNSWTIFYAQGDTSSGDGGKVMKMDFWLDSNSTRIADWGRNDKYVTPDDSGHRSLKNNFINNYTILMGQDTNGGVRLYRGMPEWRFYMKQTIPPDPFVIPPNVDTTLWLTAGTPEVWENQTRFNVSGQAKFVETASKATAVVSYMSKTDSRYESYFVARSWGAVIDPRTLASSGIEVVGTNDYRFFNYILLPPGISGVSFDYFGSDNGGQSWGVFVDSGGVTYTVKTTSNANHVTAWKNFSVIFSSISSGGATIRLDRTTGWQWLNIRNLKFYS